MTSPLTVRCMSVTSSGRSSMRRTMRATSGWLVVMELAMDCSIMVLPVRGGATIKPRCPLPTGEQVEHAAGHVFLGGFHLKAALRIERGQVVEEDFVAGDLGIFKVDGFDFDESEVALAVLGGTHLAGDGVAGAQVELADLRGRDVDVVGTG